ncbi:hypothetical protein SNE26_10270 [Mucilaginibacter sp. cycad4]|uniref:hypothetical protein n=1 Tax=Mucilaginibacter sp. cycad4 TaxID=3342096 RepID=UPI002AAB5D25|nr:hypothetical protein [Mucilaginibacter gossypii]WPV02160.1 hypothetical protein SNE26_10270 [Mucilaginibacter gossypii]
MEDVKTMLILEKLLTKGYDSDQAKDEKHLHEVLRTTDNPHLFMLICVALGKAGDIFSVPVLMALAEETSFKSDVAKEAIKALQSRVEKDSIAIMKDFFVPAYWKTLWIGPIEKFISYVACIAAFIYPETMLEGEAMNRLGELLTKEITIDFSPYQSFHELRLCSPNWDVQEDLMMILNDFESDLTLEGAIKTTSVRMNEDSQVADNIINM